MAFVAGTTIGRYEIRSKLGAGGMGEVYLANDTTLNRKVALKLLPNEASDSDHAHKRLLREARAAATLDHQNICSIYEVGEENGRSFICMQYVEGETLDVRMKRKPLDLWEAVDIATQVADALGEAHAHGIIHRDIKPSNIILTSRGQAKVMDFGLAKFAREDAGMDSDAATESLLTTPGAMVGTVPYMSPEQVRGEAVDARSDIFSFGILFYEMVCGQQPFAAASIGETVSAILTNEPYPLNRYSTNAPEELQRIVRKCLHKDRERRYQTVRDLAIDLENVGQEGKVSSTSNSQATVKRVTESVKLDGVKRKFFTGRAGYLLAAIFALLAVSVLAYALFLHRPPTPEVSGIKSLAVLPFKSLTQKGGDDYLGLGIADSVITKVSQIGGLTVRPTSAIRKYASEEIDALAAAREQQVDAVLEGTVQRAGEELRVSVNLLRVADGTSLWSQSFNMQFSDIFSIQDNVSQEVATRLRIKLSPAEQSRLTKRYTSNLEAYNYYTKAMYHFGNIRWILTTRPEADLAIDLFKKAIELDPQYALAHAQLGFAYAETAVYLEDNPGLIQQAKQELAIAERLDPQLPDVHVARYFILFSQYEGWQLETAIRELYVAQQLDPNAGHAQLGDLYTHIGLEQQAAEEFEMALKLDPNSDRIKEQIVIQYFLTARPDEALAASEKFFNRAPSLAYYVEKKMLKEAEPLIQGASKSETDPDRTPTMPALLLALQGKHQEAQTLGLSVVQTVRKNRGQHHFTYDLARIYALGSRASEAVKWLRFTVENGFPCYPLLVRDSFLDPIRKDPAFIKFMAEMKERWEGYEREFGHKSTM